MTYRTDIDLVQPDDHVLTHATEVRRVSYSPSPLATVERVLVFVFSLVVGLIGLRVLLLLLAARQGNDIVAFIYNTSEVFVAPFRGILRIDEVQAGVTALDFGAIVAIVGWLVIELIVVGVVRMFRPAATA
jgi:uncharacterized protein YggT (Ycf19 family)